MPVPALLFALAAVAQPPEPPITVTGHTWAPFISPFGEPFRARKPDQDTMADWFHGADRDHDGFLTAAEMKADAERFFAHLDTDGNGLIEPDELVQYEWEVAPEIQVGARWRRSNASSPVKPASKDGADKNKPTGPGVDHRGSDGSDYELQGAGRYALFNMPEPVAAADLDFDRAISRVEFQRAAIHRFELLDKARKGQLSLTDLEALRPPQFVPGARPKRRQEKAADTRVGVPLPAGE
jgi:Ca2+-binding EF-hand superfamily protein